MDNNYFEFLPFEVTSIVVKYLIESIKLIHEVELENIIETIFINNSNDIYKKLLSELYPKYYRDTTREYNWKELFFGISNYYEVPLNTIIEEYLLYPDCFDILKISKYIALEILNNDNIIDATDNDIYNIYIKNYKYTNTGVIDRIIKRANISNMEALWNNDTTMTILNKKINRYT